jgi:outer membrane protein
MSHNLKLPHYCFILIASFLAAGSAVTISFAQSTHDVPTHLTLDQSIAEAIRNSTAVLKSQNSDDLNAEGVLRSYGSFLPNLGLGANYAYQTGRQLYVVTGVDLVDQKNVLGNYTVSTALNIFNGLADISSLKAAEDRKDASELTLNWAKQQVALDITQSFLQVTLDQKIVIVARDNLAFSQARLELLKGQAEVGAVTTADLFRQEAQVSSDQLFLINSDTKLHDDQLVVIQKLRLNPQSNYVLDEPPLKPETIPEVKLDEDSLIAEAIASREDYKAEDSLLKATGHDITTAASTYFPRVDFSFSRLANGQYLHSYTVNSFDALPPGQEPLTGQLANQVQWTSELTFSWAIFDRFVTRYNVEYARVTDDNTRIDRDNLRIQVASEVRQIINDYTQSEHSVESAEVGLVASKKAYEVIQGRYKVGQQSFIDVLAAQATLVQAGVAEAQALINLKLQERFVKYYLGKYRFENLIKDSALNS